MPNANNIPIPLAFDPTQPPPMFYQQPLPSSMPTQQQQLPPPPQINYDRTRSTMHQVCEENHHFRKLIILFRRPMLIYVRKIWMQINLINIIILICLYRRHIVSTIAVVPVRDHRIEIRNERVHHRSKEVPNISFSSSSECFSSMDRRDSATTRLQEAEKRERQRKGLPPLKEGFLVGTLNFIVYDYMINNLVENFSELTNTVAWSFAENYQ